MDRLTEAMLLADAYERDRTAPADPAVLAQMLQGTGQGLRNQAMGAYQMVRHPVQTGRGLVDALKNVVSDPRAAARSWAQGMVQRMREAATDPRAAGVLIGENISPGSMMRRAPVMQDMTTYHGTPHTFDPVPENPLGKFDHSRMGTGEGSQAFGWGTYLAENPEVAGTYKQMGRTYKPTPDDLAEYYKPGRQLGDDTVVAYDRGTGLVTVDRKQSGRTWRTQFYDTSADAMNVADTLGKPRRYSGSVYVVDLPDEQIGKMLDWDKPLSEQPEAVRRAVGSDWEELNRANVANGMDELTGQEYYRTLIDHFAEQDGPRADQMASLHLRSMGIPGLRFLDRLSRGGKGTGTRNFVVFDENVMKIIDRK